MTNKTASEFIFSVLLLSLGAVFLVYEIFEFRTLNVYLIFSLFRFERENNNTRWTLFNNMSCISLNTAVDRIILNVLPHKSNTNDTLIWQHELDF